MPHDYAPHAPLATPEEQDAYLEAAFASRHPTLIADAVNTVANLRSSANAPANDGWETTRELFQSAANTQHLLLATAEAEAYLKATGQTAIEGPSAAE